MEAVLLLVSSLQIEDFAQVLKDLQPTKKASSEQPRKDKFTAFFVDK